MAAAIAGAQNLVKNGGFNEGNPQYGSIPPNWTPATTNDPLWGYSNDDGVCDSDPMPDCIRFSNGDGKDATVISQTVSCKPNTRYTLSAYMKVQGCVPEIKIVGQDGQLLVSRTGDQYLNGIWKQFENTFSSRKNNSITITLVGSINPGAKGKSCFDCISIVPEGTPKAANTQSADKFKPAGPNIALGKNYTMSPKPSYGLCKDPDDITQLTDGIYTQGYFWTQKTTVGWSYSKLVSVTIDLEKEEPIAGISWNTAAGTAGVSFPAGFQVFVSPDKKDWYYAGDLGLQSTKYATPPTDSYSTFKFATNELNTKGRYVQILVTAGTFIFVDEIEVFRGPETLLAKSLVNPVSKPEEVFWEKQLQNSVIKRMLTDLHVMKNSMASLPKDVRAKANPVIEQLEKDSYAIPQVNSDTFKAIFPFNDVHAKIFALNSLAMQTQGYNAPFFWHNNRWDNLNISAIPIKEQLKPLVIHMMRNEVRGETINICNPTDKDIDYNIQVNGLPADANLLLCEVLFTDTKACTQIAAALSPSPKGASITTRVHAGCNRQIWLSFRRPSTKAGMYKATITAAAENAPELSASIQLNIYDMDFPAQPTIHVGGWDYTHGNATYYKAPGNLKDNLALMRDIYVDSPWATAAVTPKGAAFDKDGHLTNADSLDFTHWNQWTARWKGARNFCVFWSASDSFYGAKMGTTKFNTMVGEYVTAWADYIKKQGINLSQLVILLVDEPHENKQDKIIIAWSKAIKAAQPNITLFNDVFYSEPAKAIQEMFEVADILCPNTPMMIDKGDKLKNFYINQRKEGRTLWLYSCSGPAKLLDPIGYHRFQHWYAFHIGAVGSFYWALGCAGEIGNSWSPYMQQGTEYSPYFVSRTSVMQGKHSEAIREGVQDYEYLVIMKNKINELRKNGKNIEADKAQNTLDHAVKLALSATNSNWIAAKEHNQMDDARIMILKALK